MTWPDATAVTVALVVVLVVGLVAWYLASCATRLDRLHHRVETASAALDYQLLRRSAASQALAASGLLDPASAILVAGAAAEASEAGETVPVWEASDAAEQTSAEHEQVRARELAESDLSRALRATLTPDAAAMVSQDPVGRDLLAELRASAHRASLARRFLNDAVSQAQRVRGKRVVRWTRLAGRAPLPQTVELDDEPPETLLP